MGDRDLTREYPETPSDGYEDHHSPTRTSGDTETFPDFDEEYNTVRGINKQMIRRVMSGNPQNVLSTRTRRPLLTIPASSARSVPNPSRARP